MSIIENITKQLDGAMTGLLGEPDTNKKSSQSSTPQENKAVVPASPQTPAADKHGKDAEIVTGTFVEGNKSPATSIAPIDIREAFGHTEDFRKVVESFDEDKQTTLEWLVSKFFTFVAYTLPTIIAWFVGVAIGDAFSSRFNAGDAYNVFAHVISVSVELVLVMLCLATVAVFRRALKDRLQIGLFIGLVVLFIVLSILNSFAQLFLLEKHITIDIHNLVPFVAVVFRSFASFVIDLICAAYLGVTGVRSLKKYLQDKRAQIEAVQEVNKIEIEMGQTRIKAAMDTQQAAMDMASKAKRAQTWNTIEAVQADAMIETAKRNMRGDEGGSYRRSRY